jgi:hypothetical protein
MTKYHKNLLFTLLVLEMSVTKICVTDVFSDIL